MDTFFVIIAVGFFVIRALLFLLVPVAVVAGVIYLLIKLIDFVLGRGAPGADGRGDG